MNKPAPLTCRDLIEILWAYESGALEQDRRTVFNRHLDACADCVDYLNTYRKTVRLVRGSARWDTSPEGVPESLIQAVLAAKKF